ncbi:MAG: hypothetical protein PHW12_00690 [Smithella sp.]|nr:hypothetical protein [Smithella sp.]MDD5672581.1 hypothetical protein [Chitinivibrionales bacterium]
MVYIMHGYADSGEQIKLNVPLCGGRKPERTHNLHYVKARNRDVSQRPERGAVPRGPARVGGAINSVTPQAATAFSSKGHS